MLVSLIRKIKFTELNKVAACLLTVFVVYSTLQISAQSMCTGKPVSGIASGPSGACANSNFSLNVSGFYYNNGLKLQWQLLNTSLNSFVDIPGATSQKFQTSQTNASYYRCIVYCAASKLSDTSNIVFVDTSNLCYCTPPTNCDYETAILNVTIDSINNTSTCINSGYGDYTKSVKPATLYGGKYSKISVTTFGKGLTNVVAVWIDYNQNGTFESFEFNKIGSKSNNLTSSIFIPTSAKGGLTRMRVRLNYITDIDSSDACKDFVYPRGETEDYTVRIIPSKIDISFLPFNDTLYNNTITLTAKISQIDVGLDNRDSVKPRLWVKRYGSEKWSSIKGILSNGTVNKGSWDFIINHDSLGIRRNGCDSVQYYFVAQDVNQPFNLAYLPLQNTAHVSTQIQITPPAIPFGYRIKPRLKDTVYVSASDCRYQTLTGEQGLFQEIELRKLEGDLTIIVESDLNEDGEYELNDTSLNKFSIRIRPDGNIVRTIRGLWNEGYLKLIKLNGVKRLTIDGSFEGAGRFLKFSNIRERWGNYKDQYICNVEINNSCDSITIKNTIQEHHYLSGSVLECSILVGSGNNGNVSLLNNLFTDVKGSEMPYTHVVNAYGSNKVIVRNNEFSNFSRYGIRFINTSNNWNIDGNHFYKIPVSSNYNSDWSAISVTGGGHSITNNYIGGNAAFCRGNRMTFINHPKSSITGIEINSPFDSITNVISNNRIDNITITKTYQNPATYFTGIDCIDNKCIINNNVIGNPDSSSSTITALAQFVQGIKSQGAQPVIIKNNIIASLGSISNVTQSGGVQMYGIFKVNTGDYSIKYNAEAVITNNRIFNLLNGLNIVTTEGVSDLGATAGIRCLGGSTNFIEQNEIHDLTVFSNAVAGIEFESGDSILRTVISRNRIYNLVNSFGGFGSCNCGYNDDIYNGSINGIALTRAALHTDIVNNQITLTNGNIPNPVTIRGIFQTYTNNENATYTRISYNTIYIGGTATENGGSSAYHSMYVPAENIRNNIFFNERKGGSTGHFAYRFVPEFSYLFTKTKGGNNFIVLTDTSLFAQSTFPAMKKYNWNSWKNVAKIDSNSYLTSPFNELAKKLFIDVNNGNLNINFNNDICWYVNGKALPDQNIRADFDSSNIRSTSIETGATDIGSDEFNTSTNPPALIIRGEHVPGGVDSLIINGRVVAVINWGTSGKLPVLGTCRWYSGSWPNDTTNNGTTIGARYMNAFWQIPASGGSDYSYSLSLYYDSSILGKITRVQDIVVNKKQIGIDGTWSNIIPTIVNSNSRIVTISNQHGFSEFTMAEKFNTLPLTNINLTGKTIGKNAILKWQATNGDNYTIYELERSFNGRDFTTVNRVTNSQEINHQYLDKNIFAGSVSRIFYRIKIYTRQNTVLYSSIVLLKSELSDEIEITRVYPNPFGNNLSIDISITQAQFLNLHVFSSSGLLVYSNSIYVNAGDNTLHVAKSDNLPAGFYTICIKGKSRTLNYKVSKQ